MSSEPSVSIGNYKGVMLCNRPFAGVTAAARDAYEKKGSKAPFKSAVYNDEPLGLNPTKAHSREIAGEQQRVNKNKNSVLSKHKKWLADLQKAKDQYQQEAEAEATEAEERKQQFMERQAQLRSQVRDTMGESKGESKQSGGKKKSKKASRPKWSLTEDECEELEDEEAEALMDFAASLDFDKYLDDLEVRAALESVRNRVAELETGESEMAAGEDAYGSGDEQYDDLGSNAGSDDGEATARRQRRRAALTKAALKEWASSREGSQAGDITPVDDDCRSIASARSVLSNHSGLRQIHSARSLVALAKRVAAERANSRRLDGIDEAGEEGAMVPPKIVTNHVRAVDKEVDPSNLPYMHRNPAV